MNLTLCRKQFFIAGTPRSRTAWLATFLDTGNVACQHEGLARFDSLEEFAARLEGAHQNVAGECGTLGPVLYPALVKRFPHARWALVHRDVEQVAADFTALRVPNPQLAAMQCERQFAEMREAMPSAAVAEFAELDGESVMRDLWDYVTWGEPFPVDRYERMRELQIQIAPWQFLDLLEQRTPRVRGLLEEIAEHPTSNIQHPTSNEEGRA